MSCSIFIEVSRAVIRILWSGHYTNRSRQVYSPRRSYLINFVFVRRKLWFMRAYTFFLSAHVCCSCIHNVGCLMILFRRRSTPHTHTHTPDSHGYTRTYIIIRSCAKDAYINVRELHVFEFSLGTYYNMYSRVSYRRLTRPESVRHTIHSTQLGGGGGGQRWCCAYIRLV